MPTITTDRGQQVHYRDHGSDGQPAVLLLHSFFMDGEMFAAQVADFGSEFRLITMDERAHGGTPADAPFDYWDVAHDALALLDHLGIARAAVIGTSQGGFIGMRMALLAPERVAALALLGTSAAAEAPEVAAAYRQSAAVWAEQGPVDALIEQTAAICLGGARHPEWERKWRAYPTEQVLLAIEALAGRDDIVARLPEITCPALVLHGTDDAAYAVAAAEQIVAGIPKSEPLVTVESGKHFLSFTNAEAVDPHLRTFLHAQL
ncbi:alpha/beta fold hydrolase [Streptomyces sp. NPDC090077]|uniref:alpha/beta fold hydrolase n=1 Tax=Streptomyces sp. NPDC090077 TaxID=3365938 RepID=UPI003805DCC2